MKILIPKQGVAKVRGLLLSASACSPDDRSIAATSLGAAVSGGIRPIDSAVSGEGERGGTTSVGIDDRFRRGTNTKPTTAVVAAPLGQQDLEGRSGGVGLD